MGEDWGTRSATELADAVRQRKIGAVELFDHYAERIERLNPALNAIVTLDLDRARAGAVAADALTALNADVGPLHGLPIPVKDALEVAGLRCTGGAVELADHVSPVGMQIVAPFLEDRTAIDVARRIGEVVGGYEVPPLAR